MPTRECASGETGQARFIEMKRVKFKLAKDFPFYIQGEVVTILPVGTEFVMDMPAEMMQKMAGLGYIQVVEEVPVG
jgi:hypothetical protein